MSSGRRSLNITDEQVLKGIREGNYEIFTSLYSDYFHNLAMVSMKYVKDVFVAEEIVQEIFIRMWESPSQLDAVYSLKSYLYRSIVNQSINYINRQKNIELIHLKIAEDTKDSYYDTLHEEQEMKRMIYGEIEKLPEQCRRVFKMSRFDNLKYREIAVELGLSERTVENHVANALKILRSRLLVAGSGRGTDYNLKFLSVLLSF